MISICARNRSSHDLSWTCASTRLLSARLTLPLALVFALLLPACSSVSTDEGIASDAPLVLRVRVMTRNATPHTQPNASGSGGAIADASWYTYRARVTEVLQGDYSDATISFANYQHEYYLRTLTRDWYVSLAPITDPTTVELLNSRYYVVNHVFAEQEDFDAHLARLLSGKHGKTGD